MNRCLVWRRLSKLLAIAVLTLPLGGCWSRIEINDRAFVTAVFVDAGEEEGEIRLTLGMPLPNRISSGNRGDSSTQGRPFATFSRTGESLAVANRLIQMDLSRELNWGHTRILVIGDKMARRGIRPILEFVLRQPSFHTKTYVLLAEREAREIVELTPVLERFPMEVLREIIERGGVIETTVKDLMMAEAYTADSMIGRLRLSEQKMVSEAGKLSKWAGVKGAGVLKNGVLVDTFNVIDMRSGMWIRGKMKNALISIESPVDGKLISFQVRNVATDVDVKAENDEVQVKIRIEGDDDIVSSQSDIDLQKPENILLVEAAMNDTLRGRIEATLEKTQRAGVDVFQIGQRVEWKYPLLWRRWKNDWREYYRDHVHFEIEPDIAVKRPGGEKTPFWKPAHN